MMNKLFLLILFLSLASVSVLKAQEDSEKQNILAENAMLLGEFGKENLLELPYAEWYNKEQQAYVVDVKTLESIKNKKDLSFIIIMGTWCSDSKREVPRFLKILEEMKISSNAIHLIGVNRDKKTLHGDVSVFAIKRIPTIIIRRKNKEIGRIVEIPKETLEKDLSKILE